MAAEVFKITNDTDWTVQVLEAGKNNLLIAILSITAIVIVSSICLVLVISDFVTFIKHLKGVRDAKNLKKRLNKVVKEIPKYRDDEGETTERKIMRYDNIIKLKMKNLRK
jgi:hypothetical protein